MGMATLPRADPRDAKQHSVALARAMREWGQLVRSFETALLRSLEDVPAQSSSPSPAPSPAWSRDRIGHEARRLASAELTAQFARKHIGRSLREAEALCRRAEQQLRRARPGASDNEDLGGIHNGYFRLHSPQLFDLLGQPADLRLGTLRFHRHADPAPALAAPPPLAAHAHAGDDPPAWISVELALANTFFIADSMENLPFHAFRMPDAPSLRNRGILSRKLDDDGAFPAFDSWLLFTFLGRGCLKLQVPIEMCADVYGGPLRGREDDDVLFWGLFVDDETL